MFLGEVKIMNDLILAKMREGDWGEVVRLMRAEYGGSPDPTPAAPKDAPREMPFHERFETVRVTPRTVADSVVEENGRFSGITFEGERYKPSRRFLKVLAQRMKVSLSVFDLFSPLEVVHRAAERAPDLPLKPASLVKRRRLRLFPVDVGYSRSDHLTTFFRCGE